jgi:hypothetical protein
MGRRDIGITKSPILLIRSYRLFEYDESWYYFWNLSLFDSLCY